jgi:hypothetical protein
LLIVEGLAGVYISGFRATHKDRREFMALGNGCCYPAAMAKALAGDDFKPAKSISLSSSI